MGSWYKRAWKNEIELELLNEDVELSKKTGEYLKGELEKNLPGLTVKIKQQPFAQKLKLEDAGDYVMSFSGWGQTSQIRSHILICL